MNDRGGPKIAAADEPVVLLDACTYSYPAFTLGPVELRVTRGRIHGLLGPNGNGKTTLLNLVMGLLRPDAGAVRVLGGVPRADGAALYARVGFAPDEDDVIDELSAREFWQLCATVLARQGPDEEDLLRRAAKTAEELSFSPPDQPASAYSHGMRRKTQLVTALMSAGDLIVLDEPTNALDPISTFSLGEVLRERALAGAAILVATHDLAWAERFTDTVSVVRSGVVSPPRATRDVLRPTEGATLLDGFMQASAAIGPDVRGQ